MVNMGHREIGGEGERGGVEEMDREIARISSGELNEQHSNRLTMVVCYYYYYCCCCYCCCYCHCCYCWWGVE